MTFQIGAMEIVLRTDLQQFTGGMRNAATAVDQSSARMSRATQGATRSVGTLERALGNIHGADSFRALTISALRAEDSLSRLKSVALLIPSALGGISVALGARALMDYADTATTVRNRLAVVLDSQSDRLKAEKEIFEVAQRTRTQYSSAASLYARTTQAAENLGRSQADILRFTEAVQKTNIISGSTTQEAAGGAIQLAQGLASGKLAGDELRSILENNLELSNILAKELAGGSKGRLRTMGAEGLLTANAIIDAVLKNIGRIDQKFTQTSPTIAQGFVLIDNAITKYVGDLDKAIGASASFVKILTSLSQSIPEVGSALAAVATIAATVFAGKALKPIVGAVSGSISAARTDYADRLVGPQLRAGAATLEASRALEEAKRLERGALAATKRPLFSFASAESINALQSATTSFQRASEGLNSAIASRDKAAKDLDRINRQIAGAERELNRAITGEAPASAKGLRAYFSAQFGVDAAKAKAEAAAQAIEDAKSTRTASTGELARALTAGDAGAVARLERNLVNASALVERRRDDHVAAVAAIATAEQKAATESARAVEAGEVAKSKAVNEALTQRQKLIEKQVAAEAVLGKAQGRVSDATITRSFAESGVQAARGAVEQTGQAGATQAFQGYVAASADIIGKQRELATATNELAAAKARASSMMGQFSAAAVTAANAAGRLATSFYSFVGGPWGVALTGMSVALGVLAYRQSEAAAAAAKHKSALEGLPETIARVDAASRGARLGTDPTKAVIDAKAALAQIQQASTAETQKFFDSLARVAGQNAASLGAILKDVFNVQPAAGGSVLGLLDEIQRKAPPTAAQILEVENRVKALATQNGLNPSVAAEVLRAAEAARSASIAADDLRRKVEGLDGLRAKVTIEMNVLGSFLNPQDSTRPSLRQIEETIMGKVSSEDAINKIREEGTTVADKRAAAEAKLQGELAKRQEYARLPKKDREAEELRDKYPNLSRDAARALLDREEAQSKSGKKGGGGKSSSDKFDDRVSLLEAEGRAAFLNDRYRDLIAQLKTLKSDPSLADETLKAIEAGTALPEKAAKILAAQDMKRQGELVREVRQRYGELAQVLPLIEERQKLLNAAVAAGQITQSAASQSMTDYITAMPQFSWINRSADAFGDVARQAANAAAGTQSWDQALKNIKASMLNLAIEEILVTPLKNAVRTMLAAAAAGGGGGGGGGGLLGGLFGGIFGGGSGAAAAGVGSLTGTGFLYHGGGTVGSPGPSRAINIADFAGARRYHSGLNPGEHRAILKQGERVLTENDARRTDRAMSGLAGRLTNDNKAAVAMRPAGDIIINAPGADAAALNRVMEEVVELRKAMNGQQAASIRSSQGRGH